MNPTAPKIGFDRFIDMAWIVETLRVRAGFSDMDQLNRLIGEQVEGLPGRKKVRTVLNRLWLEPRPELADFATRGVLLFAKSPRTSSFVLGWGMALATYPFFAQTAEIVGRLSALQGGDCTSAEVHRRMSEIYGEREGTRRMTNMALQTQANWGAIERRDRGSRIVRRAKTSVAIESETAWLVEACLRHLARPAAVATLDSLPILYPFRFEEALAYVLSRSSCLELRADGANQASVFIGRAA